MTFKDVQEMRNYVFDVIVDKELKYYDLLRVDFSYYTRDIIDIQLSFNVEKIQVEMDLEYRNNKLYLTYIDCDYIKQSHDFTELEFWENFEIILEYYIYSLENCKIHDDKKLNKLRNTLNKIVPNKKSEEPKSVEETETNDQESDKE